MNGKVIQRNKFNLKVTQILIKRSLKNKRINIFGAYA